MAEQLPLPQVETSPSSARRPAQPVGPAGGIAPPSGPAGGIAPPSGPAGGIAPVWLQRVSLLVLVLFCVYLGLLVMVLPWWRPIWDHNAFLLARPELYRFLHLGPVRGLISGLGILDIWIGVSEVVHYRDFRG